MSEIQRFPGAFVWKYQVPGSDAINSRIAKAIRDRAEDRREDPAFSWVGDHKPEVITNYWQGKDPSIFTDEDIKRIAVEPLEQLILSIKDEISLANSYTLTGFWWNCYPPGNGAPPHVHGTSAISAAYIVEQKEACPLRFLVQNHYSINPQDCGSYYKTTAEEGTVVMFPSAVVHHVLPTQNWRTTLSFNFAAGT